MYIVSDIISSDSDDSQKSIFWCKQTRISAVPWRIGIPGEHTFV